MKGSAGDGKGDVSTRLAPNGAPLVHPDERPAVAPPRSAAGLHQNPRSGPWHGT
jgi:hypothetical protein